MATDTQSGSLTARNEKSGLSSVQKASSKTPEENKWMVSIAVVFGVLMTAIDTSVVNVALPIIQGNVGATQQEITWISTGYLISVVILMPLTNWLSTQFGRKQVYLASLVVFTAASLMCGLSHTLGSLIFWRVIQGFGAGTMQPLAQAIFREAFPPQQQGVAMGLFGFLVLFGPAIGPTLGGWVTDNYSWPWIFLINIPIGVIGFFIGVQYLHNPPYEQNGQKKSIDAIGICLLAVGLATLQTVLEQGEAEDWFSSSFIVSLSVVAAITLAAFIWWELTHHSPAVDLRVLKDTTFASATIIGGILGIGLFASLFLLPQYMQLLLGFSATQAGLALMPRSAVMMVMMPIGGLLYNRLGARPLIATGLLLSIYPQWQMGHFTLETGPSDILGPQIIQGAGFALVFVALTTAALANIPRERMTSATGLNNLIRQLGGSFGTAYIVVLLTQHVAQARAELAVHTSVGSPAFMQRLQGMTGLFMAHGYTPDRAREAALGAMNGLLTRQAAMLAYDYLFLWIGLLFVACLPLVLLIKKPQTPGAAPEMVMAE